MRDRIVCSLKKQRQEAEAKAKKAKGKAKNAGSAVAMESLLDTAPIACAAATACVTELAQERLAAFAASGVTQEDFARCGFARLLFFMLASTHAVPTLVLGI